MWLLKVVFLLFAPQTYCLYIMDDSGGIQGNDLDKPGKFQSKVVK